MFATCSVSVKTARIFERRLATTQEVRILQGLLTAILSRDGGKRFDTPIKSQCGPTTSPLGPTGQDNRRIPLPVAIQDVTRLRLSHCTSIPSDTHMPHPRQPQSPMLHPLARQQAPAIAMRGITPAFEPLARFEPRIAWSLSLSAPAKERLKRPSHTYEGVLGSLGRQWRLFLLPERGQITALIRKAQRGALAFPGSTALLKRGIVQAAVGFPLRLQRSLLRWRGIQAICGAAIDSFHIVKYNLVMKTKQQLKTLYHCVYNLHFHLVIVTKYRCKCLTPAMREYLTGTFAALLDKWGGTLVECNGAADHMHLLIELPPTVRMSAFVNNLKTVSSRLLRKAYAQELARWYHKPVLWRRSYCVLSCGGAPLSVLRQYIEQQGNGAS